MFEYLHPPSVISNSVGIHHSNEWIHLLEVLKFRSNKCSTQTRADLEREISAEVSSNKRIEIISNKGIQISSAT